MISRICLLGFGEVGQVLASELGALSAVTLVIHDKLFSDGASVPSRAADKVPRVERVAEAGRAAAGCQLVISAVTAEENVQSAKAVVEGLEPEAWFLDLNSTAPETKRRVAEIVEAAGGYYVEAAVMGPIEPMRLAVPMLLGGPRAKAFQPVAQGLGLKGASFYSPVLGAAAATKMCRSVIVKGLEALVAESLLTARYYGVEESVLDSLGNLFPGADWPDLARYLISRSLEHGARRAAEMREVAKTVGDAGIAPWMTRACVERQEWAADFPAALESPDLNTMLDYILFQQSEPVKEATSS
ncbi:NAD(P)-dependent oxidoreductase [Marinimicrobium alkaliphilum]|uniref:NAD(P)-dependent oxidoreductase n=1 Tax=Marinimicrobium alkaliphilum TaxID=2202654 RepID=UPI001E5177A5|nr:DUF1932 domain-containing protein [Marinimicrobium alkaliphilum]